MKRTSMRRAIVPGIAALALLLSACGDDADGGDGDVASGGSIECLTVDQLIELWGPDSKVTNWNELDPEFPDQEIELFGPGTDSGTYDYMASEVVDPDADEPATRSDYEASEDDNVLVQGVADTEGATGYFGYTYYEQNADTLQALAIDSGNGCVEPSAETAQSGEYTPLARPAVHLREQAQVRRQRGRPGVRGLLHRQPAEQIAEVGQFIPLSDELYAETQGALEALGGSGATGASGEVVVDGSSTVYPMSVAAQELLNGENPDVQVTVGEAGTGGGFEVFCTGDTDISDASRPIDEEEIAVCEENGVEYVELQVATDALTVVVNPNF